MKIPYKRKRDYMGFTSSILLGVYGGVGLLKETSNTINYIALICSILFLLSFFFDKRTYYLTLKNGKLRTGKLFGEKINLLDIKQVIENKEKYILKTNKSELIIDTKLMDSESLDELETELNNLEVEWN